MTIVMDWNGNDLPEALREAPSGRYVLVPLEQEDELSAEEERGLVSALAAARERGTVPGEDVRAAIRGLLAR